MQIEIDIYGELTDTLNQQIVLHALYNSTDLLIVSDFNSNIKNTGTYHHKL